MKNKDFCKQMSAQEQEKRYNGNEGTANLYRAARNHFAGFIGSKVMTLKEIKPEVVQTFLLWLQGKGLQVNSVNSYMSNLRAMYNRACLGWKGRPVDSPFAGLRLKREETRKRAVPVDVIGKIASLELKEDPKKKLAADLAVFSFLACGIPFIDIVHLTKENLKENGKVLSYKRQKTGALIELEVSWGMQCIIDRYSDSGSRYLFPILSEDATYEQYKHCLAQENRYLKEICVELGLEETLTTYTFRHSWASEAYHRNVPIGIISQALGHSSEKMTRTYLSAFDVGKVGEANKKVSGSIELLVSRA